MERKTVSAGQRYSNFEVITDSEVRGSQGRQRLNDSHDLRDLRKKRDNILLERFRKPSGSRPGISKVRLEMGVELRVSQCYSHTRTCKEQNSLLLICADLY